MVPNGWKLTSLGEVCSGKLQTGPFGSQLHAHEYTNEGVPVLMPKDLINFRPNHGSAAKIPVHRAEDLKKHTLKSGDILFSRRGDVARFALIESDLPISLCGTGCLKATPNQTHSPLFLSYFLQKNAVRKWLEQNAVGQTMPNMNTAILAELPLMVASCREEEDKIAQILSTWDRGIATTEKLIDASKQQKKALMQQLLTGKKRLVDPETGKAFEGDWEEVKLSKLFARVTEKNKGQSTNVVTISAQHGLIRQEEFFKKSVASETLDNYFILRKGQFAYNKSYSNGYPMGAIKRLNRYDDAVVTSLYICFEIKNSARTSSCFMEQYFESGLINRGLTKVAAEGGRAHGLLNVKPTDFMDLALVVPEVKEQQKIASVLIAADKEIELLKAKLAHFKQEKKALMQQLLTGKRRVSLSS